jgi:hypothetical protein
MTDFTIADVLAWARTKPAGESYCYINSQSCALAQFGNATGRDLAGRTGTRLLNEWPDLHEAINPAVSRNVAHTFGALVERLEALISAEPVSDIWTKADAYLADIETVSA